MEFTNKIIVVTGASSGIGEAIAEQLHHEGAIIIGLGRKKVIRPYAYYQADVTQESEIQMVFDQIKQQYSKIDGLVNSAGITQIGTLESLSHEAFRKELEINVTGVFNVCKAAISLMKTAPSSIVNIASDLGVKAIAERVGYCPSKAALIMLTRCIAIDYAPNIRANCILPGIVDTPMAAGRFVDHPELRSIYAEMYLAKRIGTVDDMVSAAKFLLSEKNSFITGTELAVCSGGNM